MKKEKDKSKKQVRLIDVQSGFGGMEPGNCRIVSAEEVVDELQRVSIEKALVRITPEQLDSDVVLSNRKLYRAAARHSQLVPCPVVVPAVADDMPEEIDQVKEAIDNGAGAVVIRPQNDCWSLDRWCSGKLFRVLESVRMPVFCLERFIPVTEAARIAGDYPFLPVIVAEMNYRAGRMYVPLYEKFSNIYISTGNNNTMFNGLELFIRKGGVDRLLFGTGFPVTESTAAITQLMYADISNEDKRKIGSVNFERLAAGTGK